MTQDTMTITLNPPSFRATVGMLRLLAEDGNPEGKAGAWAEITRWADMLDSLAASERAAKAAAAEEETPHRDAFIAAAREAYGSDEIEVDDDAKISEGDEGAFVQGWLWVSNAEAGLDEDLGNCADCGAAAEDEWDDETQLCRDCHMARQDATHDPDAAGDAEFHRRKDEGEL